MAILLVFQNLELYLMKSYEGQKSSNLMRGLGLIYPLNITTKKTNYTLLS